MHVSPATVGVKIQLHVWKHMDWYKKNTKVGVELSEANIESLDVEKDTVVWYIVVLTKDLKTLCMWSRQSVPQKHTRIHNTHVNTTSVR